MASTSVAPLASIGGVTAGLVVLLVGVATHGLEQLQAIGGVLVVLSVGVLALYLSQLEAPE